MLNKDPRVAFCGYSTPHPSENRINDQVQTTGVPVRDVLKDVLNDLTAMWHEPVCDDHIDRAMEEFRAMRFKANQGMMELSMKSGVTSQHSDNEGRWGELLQYYYKNEDGRY